MRIATYLKEQYAKYKDWIQLPVGLVSVVATIRFLPEETWTESWLVQPLAAKWLMGLLLLFIVLFGLSVSKIIEYRNQISELNSVKKLTPEEQAIQIKKRVSERWGVLSHLFKK